MSAICIVLPRKYSDDDKARCVRFLKRCRNIGFWFRVPGIEQLLKENRMSISVSAVSLRQQEILRSRRHSHGNRPYGPGEVCREAHCQPHCAALLRKYPYLSNTLSDYSDLVVIRVNLQKNWMVGVDYRRQIRLSCLDRIWCAAKQFALEKRYPLVSSFYFMDPNFLFAPMLWLGMCRAVSCFEPWLPRRTVHLDGYSACVFFEERSGSAVRFVKRLLDGALKASSDF